MKRLFIIGNGPLPEDQEGITNAASLRTNQFIQALNKNNKEFDLILITIHDQPETKYQIEKDEQTKILRIKINKNDPGLLKKIQKNFKQQNPDILIGINTFGSYLASQIDTKIPFWADLNGWIMAEAQAQAYKMKHDLYLPHYYRMEKNIVSKADKISTVSSRQKYAILGELAFSGRLNQRNFAHDFTVHIPNATELNPKIKKTITTKKTSPTPLDQLFKKIPKNAFKIAWIGGYNTWVDEKTLFKGLELAMIQNPNIHFISTGGTLKGLDDSTFKNFQKLIQKSKFKTNFHFLGWIEQAQMPSLYDQCHVGLNIDHQCVETTTGARNRINEMMKFGLPIISTQGSEISEAIKENSIGITFPNGNIEQMAKAITTMAKFQTTDPSTLKLYGLNAQKYLEDYCSYQTTMLPFIEWLKDPKTAQDKGLKINLNKNNIKTSLQYLQANGFKKALTKLIQKVYNKL